MPDEIDRMIERAVRKWRDNVGPTPAAVAGFEAVRDLLKRHARGAGLKAKTQEMPPKYELTLPPAKRGQHPWDFAGVAAVEDDLYFDLYPLGLDVALRNSVSPALGKRAYRTDDGFKLPGGGARFLDEIALLIPAALDWFRREVIAGRPVPPCQTIDQYLLDVGDEDDAEPGAPWLQPLAGPFASRLAAAQGKGPWRRAVRTARILPPGWARACTAEVHAYERPRKAVEWKVRRFLSGVKEAACDEPLVYAAAADFPASLEPGRTYRCSATLGRRFQAYVRITDESGEDYWYPERFFVPARSAP